MPKFNNGANNAFKQAPSTKDHSSSETPFKKSVDKAKFSAHKKGHIDRVNDVEKQMIKRLIKNVKILRETNYGSGDNDTKADKSAVTEDIANMKAVTHVFYDSKYDDSSKHLSGSILDMVSSDIDNDKFSSALVSLLSATMGLYGINV